jgi:hypothetical protein
MVDPPESSTFAETRIITEHLQGMFTAIGSEVPEQHRVKYALGFVGACISMATQICGGVENHDVAEPTPTREDQIRVAELLMRTLTENFPHLPQETSIIRDTDVN